MRYGAATMLALPDGRIAMQRRDDAAPTAREKLSFWGGGKEGAEQPIETAVRELREETSLKLEEAELQHLGYVDIRTYEGTHLIVLRAHLFRAAILDDEFEVKEGVGSETYSLPDLNQRQDLSYVTTRLMPMVMQAQDVIRVA